MVTGNLKDEIADIHGISKQQVKVKKIMKRGIMVLGTLIGLTLLMGVALYPIGMKKLTRTYPNIKVEQVTIFMEADAITRGKHISAIWACTRCLGDNLGGSLITHEPIDGYVPLLGTIPASNLTSGKGGIATSYTDLDWVRAIRHGIKPNGRVEVFMYDYSTMSDRGGGNDRSHRAAPGRAYGGFNQGIRQISFCPLHLVP